MSFICWWRSADARAFENDARRRVEVVGEHANGANALAEYERLRHDWVLMDTGIKGIDGITAARQNTDTDPQARIMTVTDYSNDNLRRAALEAGAFRYIVKENLIDILETLPKA